MIMRFFNYNFFQFSNIFLSLSNFSNFHFNSSIITHDRITVIINIPSYYPLISSLNHSNDINLIIYLDHFQESYERIQVSPNPHFLCLVSHGRSLIRGGIPLSPFSRRLTRGRSCLHTNFHVPPAIFLS